LNISGRLRRGDERKRFFRIQAAIIKRAAGDGAGEFLRTRLQECAYII
jgi:hypothetical protein